MHFLRNTISLFYTDIWEGTNMHIRNSTVISNFQNFDFRKKTSKSKFLITCKIGFQRLCPDNMRALFKIVKEMPHLVKLEINGFQYEGSLALACEAIFAAARQEKNITIDLQQPYRANIYDKLVIQRKNSWKNLGTSKKQIPSHLHLLLYEHTTETFYHKLTVFVKNNLKHYIVVS